MKKHFLPLLLIILLCLPIFGCKKDVATDFYLKWTKTHTAGYYEVCEYDIKYLTNYNQDDYDFSKKSYATATMNVKDGSYYKTSVKILTSLSDGEVVLPSDGNTFYYEIKNEQVVLLEYVIGGETLTFTDKLTSVTYCKDCNNSLKPIYSLKSYDVTSINSDYNRVIRYVYTVKTEYNGNDMTFTLTDLSNTKINEYNYTNYILQKAVDTSPYVIENTGKDFIDNEALLFTARNLSLSDDETLNVAIPSYFGVKAVKVVPGATGTINDASYTINSLPITSMPYVKTAICITGTSYTGTPIIVTYQKGAIAGTEFETNLMYSAVTKLPAGMGALNYVLKTVTTSSI
ncbi:MAG: hypothetical protein J6B16_01355 [Clostridia bacterium]|nr:hypothetical protein [Clostridia bacterium]